MTRALAQGTKVALWLPRQQDRQEFLTAVLESCELHDPWVRPPHDRTEYREFLRRSVQADRTTLLARQIADGSLVGVVNINNILGGSPASATLGYYGFIRGVGGGRMTEAVGLAVGYCFGPLVLHRVEVNIQPANLRSRSLIERLGFRHEGFSPRMLRIGGKWCDHERYAITSEEWDGRVGPAAT